MATVTKTVTAKVAAFTLSSVYGQKVTIKNKTTGEITGYKWNLSSNDTKTYTFSFSGIPANATITKVSYSAPSSDTRSGTGYATIRDGSEKGFTDYASATTIKNWLVAGNRSVKIMYSFKGGTPLELSSDGNPTAKRNYSSGVTITVTYEVEETPTATGSVVHYGTENGWSQPCFVYYGVNGKWVQCNVAYGQDNTWKTDIETRTL